MPRTEFVLLTVLLSTLHRVYPAHSLSCYTCIGVREFSECQFAQCPRSTFHCGSLEVTDIDGLKENKLYFKGCVNNSCEHFFKESLDRANIEVPISLMDFDYTCCSKELCNGADGIRGSPLALIGAFLVSLGPVFLWAVL